MKKAILISLFIFSLMIAGSIPQAQVNTSPSSGTFFQYRELVVIDNGKGNYSGYQSRTWINGTEKVTGLSAQGNVQMTYNYSCSIKSPRLDYYNPQIAKGIFTFSDINCKYVNGTDNETGYTNPSVWFYTNTSIPSGSTREVLNTNMTVISTDYNYTPPTGNALIKTIYLTNMSGYVRNDEYGKFNATYNWTAYYDRSTGFIVAYVYSETDSNGRGDGFSCTNTLYVSDSSYGIAISASKPHLSKTSPFPYVLLEFIGVFVIVILILVALLSRKGKRNKIKQHSTPNRVNDNMNENVNKNREDEKIDLEPKSQGTEQVVIKEIVKVKCQYCGALIDSTAEKCPFCGAPRN
ncbi:MAG: zinc ribbon domain-containing protein [Cuniculiplasma sp.]